MKITGTRTEINKVDVEIDPMQALSGLDDIIRKHLDIPWGSYIRTDKDGKFVLQEDYRGSDYTINEFPPHECVDYLLTYQKFYKILQRAVYA